MVRGVALLVGLLAAVPAMAGDMSAEEARRFVIGKMFSYTCFEGTHGQGRVHADGSVFASLRGMPVETCFNLVRTDVNSFRGSVSGLGFAYCEFTRNQSRPHVIR